MAERAPARTTPETSAIRFEGEMRKIGRSTILRLPDDASARLPSRGQVAVKGVMNRHAFQAVLEPDGRRGHWLRVDTKLRPGPGTERERNRGARGRTNQRLARARPTKGSSDGSGRRARCLLVVGGHHTDGALGMGALDQCHQEPRNSQTTRPGRHLKTPIRKATALLLRSRSLHRPRPFEERQTRRSGVKSVSSGAL